MHTEIQTFCKSKPVFSSFASKSSFSLFFIFQVLPDDTVNIKYGISAISVLLCATATLVIVFGSKVRKTLFTLF